MYQPDPAQPEAAQPQDPSSQAAITPPQAEIEEKQGTQGAAAMLGEIAQTVLLALLLF